MTRPLVSVVITTYNTGRYLPETLESVFAQSYPEIEVIVVDDGSSDDSVARARDHGDRVQSIVRPHEGLGPARNVGIAAAKGEYLACLDSDDLWDPETLSVQVDVAMRNPASGMIVADGVSFGHPVDPKLRLYPPWLDACFTDETQQEITGQFHRMLTMGNIVMCPAQTLIPRRVVDMVGPVCVTPNGPQDYDYYLRIARSFPFTFHRAQLAGWRYRPDSLSRDGHDRPLVGLCWSVVVMDRERAAATPETRDHVEAGYRSLVRRTVWRAREQLMRGSRPDPDAMAMVYAHARWDPYVLATRALLALPPSAAVAVNRGVHASAQAVRRLRPGGA